MIWQIVCKSQLAGLFLLGTFFLTAQEQRNAAFVFHELNGQHGLTSGRYNYYIHQDKESFVWISSISGLNRFDGLRTKKYLPNVKDPHALRTGFASRSPFYDDSKDGLWFTEYEALIRYDRLRDRFDRFYATLPNGDTLRTAYSWCYVDTSVNRIWVAIEDGIYSTAIETPLNFEQVDKLEVNIKAQLYVNEEDLRCLVNFTGQNLQLRYYKKEGPLIYHEEIAFPEDLKVFDVVPVFDSLIWLGTNKGLYSFNQISKEWIPHQGQWKGQLVTNTHEVVIQNDSLIIVGTQKEGIYFYDPVKKQYITKMERIIMNQIQRFEPDLKRLNLDKNNNLWISTEADGIFYTNLDKTKFNYLDLPIKANLAVYGFTQDHLGQLCVLLADRVCVIKPRGVETIYLPQKETTLNRPEFIYFDSQQRLWVGTQSQLLLRTEMNANFQPLGNIPKVDDGTTSYNQMVELPNGDLLVANNRFKSFRLTKDLKSWQFESATKNDGTYLQGFDSNFFVSYDDKFLSVYQLEQGVLKEDTSFYSIGLVNHLIPGLRKYTYWIGTYDGLYYLEQNATRKWKINQVTGLPFRTVNSLLLDSLGQLWLGTPQGVYRYRYHLPNEEAVLFSTADGLNNTYYNEAAVISWRDSILLLGGNNGITAFKPEEVISRIPKARPVIVEIKINQKPWSISHVKTDIIANPAYFGKVRVPFRENNLEFRLSSRTYSDVENCRFIYQLLGSTDSLWYNVESNVLRLPNLSEGTYSLRIKATNSDNVLSDEIHTIAIDVDPPFHRSRLFYTLVIFILSLSVYGFYQYRLNMITQRTDAQLRVANAQTKIAISDAERALALQEKVLSEIAVLRLQMNPHFIFNSLNSVDAYILNQKPLDAHDFLIRFAELMRHILDKSEDQFNTISDEIHFLHEYLSIEQVRFGTRMSYDIHCDEQIKRNNIMIPTMVLQPFVENATIHGISNKEGEGHIQLNFVLDKNNLLLIEVIDNGVGRKRDSIQKNKTSKAIKITERRLRVLTDSLNLSQSPRFEIIDDTIAGIPSGTTVRFYFPIIQNGPRE